MNTNFSYDRMDYYAILEYLKSQASYFSGGAWSDFSDGDLGTVLLKLMAMNADTTNYQVEKGISELYLDTVKERVNAIALCKLVGYEPRHYLSASVEVQGYTTDMTFNSVIPAYTSMSNTTGTIFYYTIEDIPVTTGVNKFRAYQGTLRSLSIGVGDITTEGRYYLPDYIVGTNTFQIKQAGVVLQHVENALYGEGELCYSIHIDLDNSLYIQFPTYYETILAPNTPIDVRYLLTDGPDGSIGASVLSGNIKLDDGVIITYTNNYSSEGGSLPESVEEIRRNAPSYAKTMNSLVTLNDFRILAKEYEGISDVVALDYNFPESGLTPPTEAGDVNDAYKVNVYMLLNDSDTIIKDDSEIDESVGEYISDSNFNVSSTINLMFNEANQTYTTKGEHANIVGTPSSEIFPNLLEIIVKFTSTGEITDTININYGSDIHYELSGGDADVIRIPKDQLLEEDPLSISFINNSETGKLTFSVFLVTDASDPTRTAYKNLVQDYMDDVKQKRPAGITVNYFDVNYIRPHIVMNVYMNKEDLRYNTTAALVANFLEETYSRTKRKIGEAVYTSHIFKEILDQFNYINYLEITSIEYAISGAIRPNNTEFVELLAKNITVNVLPYEGD